MNLPNKFDQAVKAQSTTEQWEEYKDIVKDEVTNMDDFAMRNFAETMHRVGKVARRLSERLTNEDIPMKYKVNVDIIDGYSKGDVITHATRHHLLDYGCPEKWFQPIEQVEVSDYFKRGGAIYRVIKQSIYEDWHWNVLRVAGDSYMPTEDDYKTEQIEHRKLSTDEIEEALKKECYNRYEERQQIETVCGNKKDVSFQELKYLPEGDQLVAYSGLQQGYITFYEKGNWATIIDQTPDIEINGKQIEVEDGTVKISCGDTIDEEMFKQFYALVNKYDLQVSRNGEQINEQLRKIWDEIGTTNGSNIEWHISVDDSTIFRV